MIDDGRAPKPTAAFRRVVQRAVVRVEGSGSQIVTGAQLLMEIFSESESPTSWLLNKQGMSRQDAAHFIIHGSVKGSGDTGPRMG